MPPPLTRLSAALPGTIEWTEGWLQNTFEDVCNGHPEVVDLIQVEGLGLSADIYNRLGSRVQGLLSY